jgi:hypothetical protein
VHREGSLKLIYCIMGCLFGFQNRFKKYKTYNNKILHLYTYISWCCWSPLIRISQSYYRYV